jgi:RimJ/RimL family protein N-acetyltransferase
MKVNSAMEIKLRLIRDSDFDDEYLSWYTNDDGHLKYFSGSGKVFDRESLIEDYREGLKSKRWFYYIIESGDSDRIGTVKIGPIDLRNRTSDLVCLIGNRKYLGKGLATTAISEANRIAFDRHGIRRLHSGMYASNIAAIKAYTRAGWFVEATFTGFYLLDGQAIDRVCVACLNPTFFGEGSPGVSGEY